jgi:hypothetical protein
MYVTLQSIALLDLIAQPLFLTNHTYSDNSIKFETIQS